MNRDEPAIADLRLRITLLIFSSWAMTLVGGWCLLWGSLVLLLRATGGWPRTTMAWGALGILPVLLAAGGIAWRRRPSAFAVRATLDRVNSCGGLLMAADETAIGEWQRRLPALAVPSLRWNARRPAIVMLAGVAFLAVGFIIPQRLVESTTSRRLDVSRDVARLTTQIETLAEVKILETQQARALQEKLEQIAGEASGRDPVKTWEALDHVQDTLARAAAEAAEKATEKAGSLAEGQLLAEALEKSDPVLNPETLKEMFDELKDITERAAEENEDLLRNISPELAEAIQNSELSDAQLDEVRDLLNQSSERLSEMAQKLEALGLIDADLAQRLRPADSSSGTDSESESSADAALELREFLSQNPGIPIDEAIVIIRQPGRGGIDRGRGDAEMTWKDPSSEEGVKFKEQELPPAKLNALKDSKLSAISMAAPKVDEKAAGSSGGALKDASAGGGAAFTHTVLPRHQAAVKKYFEREEKDAKK
ncbi:MAG: hypothetical protein IT444_05435 [Phycisphaeraceae bacterium]|nr:hypothetical protein [Phycisphaeraceae bacterium]